MTAAFDRYRDDYERVVENSVAFSGLGHDFFLTAKIVRLRALFARHFGEAKPHLLDVGCGVGRMHPLLLPLVSRLSGSDVSAASVARAAADNPEVSYRQGEGGTLPWEDGAVDATLAVCVLHHVPVAERTFFLAEMARVTRPGGLVILIEHNPWNPLTRLAVARCPFDHDAVLLKHGEAAERLREAGLLQVESRHFLVAPSLATPLQRVESWLAGLPIGAQYITQGVK
jgi:SAM-dependent methyltransferase